MDTVSVNVTTRELRAGLSDVIGRTMYGHERVGVTRNGKLSAVVISVEDLELLEQLEMAQDVETYRTAKVDDDGTRVSLADLRRELNA
jgi:prevent-host-death family protein